jgi:hypothetical protein
VTFNASPDYETKSSYTFNVVASDGTTTSSQAVTVAVTDVAPTITSATSVTVPEGTSTATVVYTAAATDPAGGAVSFSLAGADAGAFTINAATGAVTFNASPDYETKSSYTFNVVASDGTTTSSQAVTVAVTYTPPSVAAAIPDQVATPGTAFGYTLPPGTFTDDDPLTFSATQVGGSPLPAWLTFNPATGAFSGTPPVGFVSIDIKVSASDGTSSASDIFTISVNAPAAPAAAPAAASASVPLTRPADSGGSLTTPPAATPSAPVVVVAAPVPAETFDSMALRQPVDASVPASHLNPNAPAAPVSLPGAVDLNTLPPTGAGPSDLVGFPVERLTHDDAASAMRAADAGLAISGERLFVYHGIPTLELTGDGIGSVRVPQDAFAHTDPKAVVQLEARLINGSPLPAWLQFGGTSGLFRGAPPEGLRGSLEIEVIARDSEGREARTAFVLQVEGLRTAEAQRVQETPDIMLGLDVDAKEREKARLEAARRAAEARSGEKPRPGAAGKLQKEPAASFTDQVRAAKAKRDPLLDKIAGSDPNGRGNRR